MSASDDLASALSDLRALTEPVQLHPDEPLIAAPRAVKMRLLELTRGGHRPSSFAIGRGGGDTILPASDRADVTINKWQRQYRDGAKAAATAAARARDAQQKILARRRPKPADIDETAPAPIWCTNHSKLDTFEPRADVAWAGPTNTLCAWCYRFRLAHGFVPPLALLQIQIAKHARGSYVTQKDLDALGITPDPNRAEPQNGAGEPDDTHRVADPLPSPPSSTPCTP